MQSGGAAVMDRYISIINWEKYQHYKDRNPPWIKLYHSLLDNYEYSCLQDDSKLLLLSFYMLASRKNNKIPYDLEWIKSKLMLSHDVNIDDLVTYGFIEINEYCKQDDSNVIAICKQNACLETETETETDICQKLKFKRKVSIPKNIHLTTAMTDYANRKRWLLDPAEEFDRFVSYHKANGSKYSDWYAAWQKWVQNDIKWHPEHKAPIVEKV